MIFTSQIYNIALELFLVNSQDKRTEAVEQLIHKPLRIHLKSLAVVVQCAVALFLTMSATSSSLMSLAPAQSLSQPRRVKLVQSPTSLSVSLPISRMLCLKSNHQRNLFACCSLNVQDSAGQDTPIEKRYPAFPTVMDINQIREILPHRFPFLLVDRVIEYNPGVSAVAIKNVTINDNFFPGHFPERPIMPGVLMIEAMAQVGGLVMLQPEVGGSRDSFFFAGIDKVRFRKPVIAGDTLVMRMTLVKFQKRFGIAKMEGKAYVGGDLVCEGEFLMASGSV